MKREEFIRLQIGASDVKPVGSGWAWKIAIAITSIMVIAFCTQQEFIAFMLGFLAAIIAVTSDEGGKSIALKKYWKDQIDDR